MIFVTFGHDAQLVIVNPWVKLFLLVAMRMVDFDVPP
jgi:hypothetical protein